MNLQQFAERKPHNERERNPQRRVNKTAAPRLDDLVKIHAEAQRNHGSLQEKARQIPAVGGKRMSNAQAKNNSGRQSDRRGNIAAGGNDEAGKEKRFDDQGF